MAILAIFNCAGISTDAYQSLRREVRWESQTPRGGIFHAAAVDDSGDLHVADVWDSVEAMQAFFEQRLLPAMQKLGVPPPQAVVFPTININAYAAIEPFVRR
jgi:hypothetical protein